MVRVSVRRVGSLTGKLAAAPESLAALLALATKKLKLDKPASRVKVGDDALREAGKRGAIDIRSQLVCERVR